MDDVFEYNQHFVAMMNIINASRLNPPEHGHRHHIIPKSWFKAKGIDVDNSSKNIVLLSVEDHAKIHKLAYLCIKDKEVKHCMAVAAFLMGQPSTNLKYEHSVETKKKISDANKGKQFTDEHRERISASHKGITTWNKGIPHTEETKAKIGAKSRNRKHTAKTKMNMTRSHIRTEFGKKFFDRYGYSTSTNPTLYMSEKAYYNKHGHCSWENV